MPPSYHCSVITPSHVSIHRPVLSERWFASCAPVGACYSRIWRYVNKLAVLKRRHPRPRLDLLDKLFWVAIRRFWSGWQQSLIAVTPETVVRWHKAGFRLY